jgi:hypothetical protein
LRFLKRFLVGIYIFLAVFSIATLIIFAFTGIEPVILIGGVFGMVGVESVIGYFIKILSDKDKKG